MTASPSPGDRLVYTLVLAVLAACAACGGPLVKGTPGQWAEARAIAEQHADATEHAPPDKVREGNPRLPFLFDAILAKSSWVLVHDGQVIEGGGLAKLGAYLDAIDVYADRALTADDVTDLLYVFQAFPPVDAMAGAPEYYLTEEGTELSVRATWRGHDLDLTLAYRLEAPNVPGLQAGGMTTADSATWQMVVSFWTLHLRKGALPRWTEERRQITRKNPRTDDD